MRIVRAGCGFRVILHTEQRQVPVAQAFERIVVQVDVRQFDFAIGQRVRIDGKVVVVRRDLDLPGPQLLHRMISAMMSEFQLEGFAAQRNSRQLMTETDSEDWLTTHEAPDRVHRVRTRLGIAWAVREKNSVRL